MKRKKMMMTDISSIGKKMKEQPKSIRRICMVSSALFSVTACVYGWTAALGAALGLAVNLTEDKKAFNKEELNKVVEIAIQRTKENISSGDKINILTELCKMEIEPDSLSELIKRTETYQTKYCTEKDAKEILNMFEMFFRDEIAHNSYLSNLYILSTGFMTLEKLEQINEIYTNDKEKLDKIQNEVSGMHKMLIETKKFLYECLNGIIFILIAMAVFLGISVFSGITYDKMMIGVAPICYGISEFLIFFLNKKGYTTSIYGWTSKTYKLNVRRKCLEKVTESIISIFITVACFLIIFCSVEIRGELLFPTLNLVCGSLISIQLKIMLFRSTD